MTPSPAPAQPPAPPPPSAPPPSPPAAPSIQPFDNGSYVKVKPITFRYWLWLDFLLIEHMGLSIQVPPSPKKHAFFACWLSAPSAIFLTPQPRPGHKRPRQLPLRLLPYESSSNNYFGGLLSAPVVVPYPNHPPLLLHPPPPPPLACRARTPPFRKGTRSAPGLVLFIDRLVRFCFSCRRCGSCVSFPTRRNQLIALFPPFLVLNKAPGKGDFWANTQAPGSQRSLPSQPEVIYMYAWEDGCLLSCLCSHKSPFVSPDRSIWGC